MPPKHEAAWGRSAEQRERARLLVVIQGRLSVRNLTGDTCQAFGILLEFGELTQNVAEAVNHGLPLAGEEGRAVPEHQNQRLGYAQYIAVAGCA